jgi:hypothetical protein
VEDAVSDEHPAGWNPMRWDCEKRGCFNVYMRPKIEVFADCFPGKISGGDVDMLTEINGFFVLLERKSPSAPDDLPTGQRISFQRFTRLPGNVVFVVWGDAKTMEVDAFQTVWKGRLGECREGTLNDVKASVKRWAEYAQGLKRP